MVPGCWYILKASPEEAHHLHLPHAPHGDEKSAPKDEGADDAEEEVEDAAPAEKEEKEEKSEVKAEDAENKDLETSDQSNSGAKPAENDYQGDNTIKHIPNDKGATKLRKDSTNAVKAGTEDNVVRSDDPRAPKDFVRSISPNDCLTHTHIPVGRRIQDCW